VLNPWSAGSIGDPDEAPADGGVNLSEDRDLLASFAAEADERLTDAEAHLLSLESNPTSEESLAGVMRAVHTLEGASGFLQLEHLARLSHELEDVLQLARRGRGLSGEGILDLAFEGIDLLRALVDDVRCFLATGERPAPSPGLEEYQARLYAVAMPPGRERARGAPGSHRTRQEPRTDH
jgi:two-component system chemotaxis sensor kinase CheA